MTIHFKEDNKKEITMKEDSLLQKLNREKELSSPLPKAQITSSFQMDTWEDKYLIYILALHFRIGGYHGNSNYNNFKIGTFVKLLFDDFINSEEIQKVIKEIFSKSTEKTIRKQLLSSAKNPFISQGFEEMFKNVDLERIIKGKK
tara:strand:- start:209 stop:643 length:435 start_codon:yes stop_codon:yes gene_type:complete